MSTLVFKRKIRQHPDEYGRMKVHISASAYGKLLEVGDETGESLKNIVSRMVEYAYENVAYDSEAEEGEGGTNEAIH